jgi:hypothetical protein
MADVGQRVSLLHVYNYTTESPKSYQILVDSEMLILPSESIPILYKNAIKQEPGFDPEIFESMFEVAKKNFV